MRERTRGPPSRKCEAMSGTSRGPGLRSRIPTRAVASARTTSAGAQAAATGAPTAMVAAATRRRDGSGASSTRGNRALQHAEQGGLIGRSRHERKCTQRGRIGWIARDHIGESQERCLARGRLPHVAHQLGEWHSDRGRRQLAERLQGRDREQGIGRELEQGAGRPRIADLAQCVHRRELQPEIAPQERQEVRHRLGSPEGTECLDRRLGHIGIGMVEVWEDGCGTVMVGDAREDLEREHRELGVDRAGQHHLQRGHRQGPWRSSAAMAPFRSTARSSFATRRTSRAGSR